MTTITDLNPDNMFVLVNYDGSWYLEKVYDAYGVHDPEGEVKTYTKLKSSHEKSVPVGKNFMTKLEAKIKALR